jgi:hypothetical protein
MKSQQPLVDMASDMIGQLYEAGTINGPQEQAARMFEAARASFLRELPDISGYKSCLAGSVPGYDDGDGDAAVIAAYRSLEARLTRGQRVNLVVTCDGQTPANVWLLRDALDVLAGRKIVDTVCGGV